MGKKTVFKPNFQSDHLCLVASLPSDLLAKVNLIEIDLLINSIAMIIHDNLVDNLVNVGDFKLTQAMHITSCFKV